MDHMFDWTIFSNQSSLRVVVMHVRPPSAHPGFITLNPDKMQRNPNYQKCNPHTMMQAQGLLAKGWGGASDVYVKLKLGDFQRHVTTVKVLVSAFRVFRVGTMTHVTHHTLHVTRHFASGWYHVAGMERGVSVRCCQSQCFGCHHSLVQTNVRTVLLHIALHALHARRHASHTSAHAATVH